MESKKESLFERWKAIEDQDDDNNRLHFQQLKESWSVPFINFFLFIRLTIICMVIKGVRYGRASSLTRSLCGAPKEYL